MKLKLFNTKISPFFRLLCAALTAYCLFAVYRFATMFQTSEYPVLLLIFIATMVVYAIEGLAMTFSGRLIYLDSGKPPKPVQPKDHKPRIKSPIFVFLDDLLAKHWTIRFWGLLDLLTLILILDYLKTLFSVIQRDIQGFVPSHIVLIPHYITFVIGCSLIFSGVLLLKNRKSGYILYLIQCFPRMFVVLLSAYPLFWLFGFDVDDRNSKLYVASLLFFEFIKIRSIELILKGSRTTQTPQL